MQKDLAGGLGLLIIAGLYSAGITQISDNALSDDVGAAGLPRMLAILLAIVAVGLIARGFLAGRRTAGAAAGGGSAGAEDEDDETASLPRAVGLLLFGVAYVAILPFAGYLLSVTLLITGVGLYEGTARSWRLPLIAFGGAAFYWAVFVKLLGVHQPAGLFFSGFLS